LELKTKEIKMTAIELYYSTLPNSAVPYCMEDDPSMEDGHIPTEIEIAAEWEYTLMLSAGISPASFEPGYYDF